MIHIVHIITGLNNGGAETMLLKLLSGLDRNIFSSSVISLSKRGIMADRIEALGVKVISCEMDSGKFSPIKLFRLINYLRQLKPDLVQTWLYHSDLLGGLAARIIGCKNVYWNIRHNNLDSDKNKRHTLLAVRANAILSGYIPRKIICNSSNSARIHQNIGFDPDRFAIIPNGFDVEQFKPNIQARKNIRDELGIGDDTPLIGLIARFDPQKNHHGFIEAASKILYSIPNSIFLLAGTDICWTNQVLCAWIDLHNLRNHVKLLSRRDDIPAITAALDVAVSTSWGEGFPNAIGEAMASGIPCVVTDVGDCRHIVGNTGKVVQAGDMDDMASRVCEILTMPKESLHILREAARLRITDNFMLPEIIKQYEALYTSSVNQGHS